MTELENIKDDKKMKRNCFIFSSFKGKRKVVDCQPVERYRDYHHQHHLIDYCRHPLHSTSFSSWGSRRRLNSVQVKAIC